ncbi:MAG TPA: heme-binding domain-containing protein [Chloroflexota bacterium]|nr:heme-binding domain-containing protein [Chloroflexota bacterium]
MNVKRVLLIGLVVVVGGFLLIQVIPYGRDHTNPPVISEPAWDSPQTRALAERACFDCHSNETVWPWYSQVAPVSWLVQHDVDEGRRELNFSEWGYGRKEGEAGEEMAEVIWEGEMPPAQFLLTHPEAHLTDAEKQQLVRGLTATGISSGGESGEHEGDD